MAHNDSCPTSESELKTIDLEPGCATKAPKNRDFISDWVDITVENEIRRGKKLREEKPLPDKSTIEYDVVNIDFWEPVCPENQRSKRNDLRKPRKNKTCPSRSIYTSPFLRQMSPSIAYSPSNRFKRIHFPRTKRKGQRKCSMRIAELAVPTKRQCIDTWRYKSYVLPEFMVERLKQHVLDQRPVVKIQDAINCFQRRKPQSSKSSSKSAKNCTFRCPQNKNEINDYLLKPYRQMDTRSLCIIFGHKIAEKLTTPMNITLSSDMEKISRIVAKDIGMMIYKPQCVSNQINFENPKSNSILMDVSSKITVWIAEILEDLSYKLLEEDLKAEKEKEAQDAITEQFVTIVEKTIRRKEQKHKTTDLEEEEGPVLDFLDDVVDNVIEICEPPPVFLDEDSYTSDSSKGGTMREESEKPLSPTESKEKNKTKLDQIFDTEEANTDDGQNFTEETDDLIDTDDILTDTEYFKNEIGNIISNNINKESQEDIDKGSGDELEKENNQEVPPEAEMDSVLDDETDKINDDSKDIKQNDDNEEAIDNVENNLPNVSEVFELLSEDSGDDKNSKNIKFSVTDLVNPDINTDQINISTNEEPAGDEQEQSQRQTNTDKSKPNIIFAEPNQNLLSDSDESWVGELTDKPILKITESVSKSVSSLGKIFENDEKQITPIDSVTILSDKKEHDTKTQEKAIGNEIDDLVCPEKFDIGNQTNKENVKETTTETDNIYTTDKVDSNNLDKQNIGECVIDPEALDNKIVDEPNKQEKHQVDIKGSGTIEVNKTASNASIIQEGYINAHTASHKTKSQIDHGWKVHPNTAPSWVISWGQGRGEPSEDSVSMKMRPTKVKESDMRKWCKDLEKAFTNLEMWSNWIESTCKETAFLVTQKGTECPGLWRKSATDWVRLKKNIHKDAILWNKLYQRTENNFKCLKRKYNNVELTSNRSVTSAINKDILDAMSEIENLSLLLHQMIVTAEYRAMCTCCKNDTRRNINTPDFPM